MRRAGAGLIDVDDELIAETPGEDLVCGRDDRVCDRRRSRRPSAALASAAAFLTRMVAVTRSAGARKAADRKVLDRARRLHAVVRVRRHLQLAERIALGTVTLMLTLPGLSILTGLCCLHSSTACCNSSSGPRPICRPTCARRWKTTLECRAGGHAIRAGADDHRAEHRSRRRHRRRDLPGHRHADLRGEDAGRRESDLDARSRFARRSPKRRGAASCGRTRSIRSPARTPATTSAPARRSSISISGRRDEIEIKLILKGGGCENTNAQYALPVELPHLGRADRTLDGVRKCILHAVWNAQGKGCSPGAVGVCVGGDRTSGYTHAKGAAVSHARRREPGSAAGRARSVDHGDGQQSRDRHDGLRRQGHADRLQDRRAQPAAGELLRVGRLRLLGVPPPRRRARRSRPARSSSGSTAIRRIRSSRCSIRPASRAPAARSRYVRR